MTDILNIVIVEDDELLCREFYELTEISDDFHLAGITNKSDKAVEMIMDTLPDAVILDLELHLGKGSGLDVLQALLSVSMDKRPYFLVTTNNSSRTTYEAARSLGADYIMAKHQENYSCRMVLDFLRTMRPAIKNMPKSTNTVSATPETPEQQSKRIYRRIMEELNQVGISPKSIGYAYLTEAIYITTKQPAPNICTALADKYRKSEASIERAMQNAIDRAWKTYDVDELLRRYTARIHSSKGCPTVTEFIYFYANKLKNEY